MKSYFVFGVLVVLAASVSGKPTDAYEESTGLPGLASLTDHMEKDRV